MSIRIRQAGHVAHALIAIMIVKVGLRLGGVRRTLVWVHHSAERAAQRHQVSVAGTHNVAHTALTAIGAAVAIFPARARCLEQSLVLYHWLRCSGENVELVFGVQPRPFKAHCWVTLNGEPVGETEAVRRYTPLPSLVYE